MSQTKEKTKKTKAGLATAGEATAFFSISRSTLWRLERQGALIPVRIGRCLRYRWNDLLQMAGEPGEQEGDAA